MSPQNMVLRSLTTIESAYISEAWRLSKVIDEANMNYDELIELERCIKCEYQIDNITQEMFERVKECLLRRKMGSESISESYPN